MAFAYIEVSQTIRPNFMYISIIIRANTIHPNYAYETNPKSNKHIISIVHPFELEIEWFEFVHIIYQTQKFVTLKRILLF